MRPKKVILLLSDDEDQLGMVAFQLAIHGYRPVKLSSVAGALESLSHGSGDLVILYFKSGDEEAAMAAINLLKRKAAHIPAMLVGSPREPAKFLHLADALLSAGVSTADLLARIWFLTARKRGPVAA